MIIDFDLSPSQEEIQYVQSEDAQATKPLTEDDVQQQFEILSTNAQTISDMEESLMAMGERIEEVGGSEKLPAEEYQVFKQVMDEYTNNYRNNSVDTNATLWGEYYQTEADEDKMTQFKSGISSAEVPKQVSEDIKGAIDAFSTELEDVNLTSEAAQALLEQTAAHESMGFKHKKQLKGGPARSYFQVEPDTAYDIVHNASNILGNKFKEFTGLSVDSLKKKSKNQLGELLLSNQKFAASMAAVTYYRNMKTKGV